MIALRRRKRCYEIYVEPVADPLDLPRQGRSEVLARHIQAFADRLAHYCRVEPYQWFNFYDFWSRDGQRVEE